MARRLRPGHCFIALQSPEDTYSDVLDVLARHDVHLDRHTMINMYRVFLNTFHTMPVPSNVLPGHAQHPRRPIPRTQ
ncbi:hypothetical protein P3342_013134 [Pyrenophora teres f. teres]|nr:hypothetical protein P3342_013134 [Pyrenophora teres f. teres]